MHGHGADDDANAPLIPAHSVSPSNPRVGHNNITHYLV